ncbi:MAG: hypothetical protein F4180_06870 [Chloroflexi bacterium]|nr:hypothetical protein [Chloroflexota bacterium]
MFLVVLRYGFGFVACYLGMLGYPDLQTKQATSWLYWAAAFAMFMLFIALIVELYVTIKKVLERFFP